MRERGTAREGKREVDARAVGERATTADGRATTLSEVFLSAGQNGDDDGCLGERVGGVQPGSSIGMGGKKGAGERPGE